jgi:methyl-accepting chemotaxis protein
MKLWRNLSIIWKLNLLIVTISAAVLLLATICFVLQYKNEFEETMVLELEALAEVIGFNTAPALLFDDRAAAMQSLAALGAKKHVVAACIYDRTGALFCAFTPKSKRQDIPVSPSSDDEHYFDAAHLHLYRKIKINNDTVGTIYIRHDLQLLHQKLVQSLTIAAAIFMVNLFVIVALSVLFQHIISKPIFSLMRAVKKISREKDYSVRVENKYSDEVGILIDGFNEMLHEIQYRDLHLEQQVEKRTAELQAANTTLTEEMQERSLVELERGKLIQELKTALAEVKTLSGLLPICCSCKKIRDDGGYWRQIETYVAERSQAEFSHGICPDCAKKLYPDYFDEE